MKSTSLAGVLIVIVQFTGCSQESKTNQNPTAAGTNNSATQTKKRIPVQFVGNWIEDNTNGPCDRLRINKDQLIWNRSDKINKGDNILKLDKINIVTNGADISLEFIVKNYQEATVDEKPALIQSDAVFDIYSDGSKLKMQHIEMLISGNLGGAALGGTRTETHRFTKQ